MGRALAFWSHLEWLRAAFFWSVDILSKHLFMAVEFSLRLPRFFFVSLLFKFITCLCGSIHVLLGK